MSFSSDSDRNDAARSRENATILANLRKLAQSNPVKDFAAAKQNGDLRLLAVMGYARVVPGVPEYDKKYAKYIGVKVIPGTTDAITSPEQGRILDAVDSYAVKYNRLVIAYWVKHRPKTSK
jgi:hypothetical protein